MTKAENLKSLSIVLPVFNEATRIVDGVKQAIELAQLWHSQHQGDWEIIVADDGSSDDTLALLGRLEHREIRILRLKHQGKGHAVQQGVLASQHQRIVFSDIDWSVPVHQVLDMINMDKSIVIASREVQGSRRVAEPPWRHLLGKIFNRWVQWTLLSGYMDTQCGCKVFDRPNALWLFGQLQEKGWAFDVELLLMAHLSGWQVQEFPVSWQYQSQSKIRILKDGWDMAQAILRIRQRLLSGGYH